MKVARRYGLVRAIAFVLKLLAWLILVAAIAGAIFGVSLLGKPAQALLSPALLGTGTVVVALLTGIFWFVPLYAFGSVLSLLLDIEENTRAMAAVTQGADILEQPPA